MHARRAAEKRQKKTAFFRAAGHTGRPPPRPDFAWVKRWAGTLLRFALRKPAAGTLLRFAPEKPTEAQDFPTLLWQSVSGRVFSALPCQSRRAGCLSRCALVKAPGGSVCCAARPNVPGEGEVGFLGVPGGDRAPLTREFPTN